METLFDIPKITQTLKAKQAEEPLNLAAGQRAGTSYVNDVAAGGE